MEMAKAPRDNRVPMMLSDEELRSIDDWRFSNRVATRSDAIRRLCQIGLEFDRGAKALDDMAMSALEEQVEFCNSIAASGETPETVTPGFVARLVHRHIDVMKLLMDIGLKISAPAEAASRLRASGRIGDALGAAAGAVEGVGRASELWTKAAKATDE